MAKNTTTLSYRITFEGKQAKDYAIDLKNQMQSLGESINKVTKEIAELEKTGGDTAAKKIELSGFLESMKTLISQYKKTVTEIKGYNQILKDLAGSAYSDLTRTQTMLTRSLKNAEPGTKKYIKLLEQLRQVKEEVNKRNLEFKDFDRSQSKINKMMIAMKDLSTMSSESLKAQKEYWEKLAEGSDEGSRHQLRFKQNLEAIIAEEKRRIEQQREAIANNPKQYSVDEIKEAIKLTEKLRDAQQPNSAEYKKFNQELKNMQKVLAGAGKEAINIDKIMDSLDSQPLEKLEEAARQLEEELRQLAPDTKKFIKASANLRQVNSQIDEIKDRWKDHDNQLVATIRRLSSYVAVYGSFNFITGKMKDMYNGMKELSDYMSDVQKTTGIAGEQLVMLSKDLDKIDTRTSQEQLHNLAATAGQIGLKSSTDVLGFVKASNQLNVALNELGEDGVTSLAKIGQLTGDFKRLGVEKSMIAIGSSINELSANSSASAGPISEFIRRVGAVAPMAKLATSDIAALGATTDALGQQVEVSSTAISKFISSVVNNTEGIAYALNMDTDSLRNLIESENTMEAIIRILEKVKMESGNGGTALKEMFKEFGSEGERMSRTIQALADNTDFLRQQVELSSKAFAEATSVTEEYNVKNENAAALAERIGNVWREAFVNSGAVPAITEILRSILNLSKYLTGTSKSVAALKTALTAIAVAMTAVKLNIEGIVLSLLKKVKTFKLTNITLISHIKTLRTAERGTMAYNRAVVSLNASFKSFLASNWFTLAAAAAASIYIAVKNWNKEQKELNKSFAI